MKKSEMYQFVRNDEDKIFTFSGVEFHRYGMLYTPSQVLSHFGMESDRRGESYKEFTSKYGITPRNFIKVHNAIKTEQWINPVRDLSKKLCFGFSRKPCASSIERLHKQLPTIRRIQADGIDNIIPICFELNSTPSELKSELGKGLWKQLCKNSFTRNLLISKCVHIANICTGSDTVESVKTLNLLPSGVLKRGGNSPVPMSDAGVWICNNKLHVGGTRRDVDYIRHTYDDTKRMAKQLNRAFTPAKWTLEKLNEKHEEYCSLVNALESSPDKLPVLDNIKVKTDKYKGYDITLLDSRYLIKKEGIVMHHCVGSYTDSVVEGRYLVYSITKDGERSSTLGINILTPHLELLSQSFL